ncbi:DUF4116 domain-containing protein [Durusdinium trenchii]|uniref:DUF4116 domain-containing protein n=1 Tax=Durusdinium trenchii TaxID=1381693 RepID=A0ABP0JFW1_9DINO
MAAVSQTGHAIQHAAEELRSDRDVVVAALKGSPEAWMLLPPQCTANKDVMLALINLSGRHLQLADSCLKADPDVVMAALRSDVFSLQADRDFAIEAVKQNPRVLRYLGKLQQDVMVISAATKSSGSAMHLAWEDPFF